MNWTYDCLLPVLENPKKCEFCKVPCNNDWCPAKEKEE